MLKPVAETPWHGYHGVLAAAAWSPDGTRIAGQLTGGMPRIAIWDAQTLRKEALYPNLTFRQWVDDENILARTGDDHYVLVAIPDGETTPVDLTPFGDEAQITDLRFSPHGRYVVALAAPRTVLVYEPATHDLQRYDVPRSARGMLDLNFGFITKDENWLFLWSRAELDPGAFTVVFNLHQKRRYAIYPGRLMALSPDENRVLVLDRDISVKVAFTGPRLSAFSFGVGRYDPQTETFDSWLAVSTDFASQTQVGMLFAHTSPPFDAQVLWRQIGSREIVKTLRLTQIAGGANLRFAPDRQRFLTTSHDGYLRVWDLEGHLVAETRAADEVMGLFSYPDLAVEITPNGQRLARTDGFQGIAIFTLPNNEPDFILRRPEKNDLVNTSIFFRFVNDHLLTLSSPEGVQMWDLNTQKVTHTYMQGAAWWPDCKADAQARLLLCASRFVALVDGATQEILGQLEDGKHVQAKAIQPQGQYVALCNQPPYGHEAIFLWRTQPLQRLPNLLLTVKGKPKPACGRLTFSSDGRYLISSAGGVWEVASGDQVGEFTPSREEPPPDERPSSLPPLQIGAGPGDFFWMYDPADHSLALYSLPSGRHIRTLILPAGTLAFRFTEDGSRLVVVQTDRITTWQATP